MKNKKMFPDQPVTAPGNGGIKRDKAALRTALRQRRTAIPGATRLEHSKIIAERILGLEEIEAAKNIFVYISHASEVSTHALIDALLASGKTLLAPRIIDGEHMQAGAFNCRQMLLPGKYGILAPRASRPFNGGIDAALIPGLGFTASGGRLGNGRGYYDRWLTGNTVKCKIALAFETQIVSELPLEATDVAVEKIITERRLINVDNH